MSAKTQINVWSLLVPFKLKVKKPQHYIIIFSLLMNKLAIQCNIPYHRCNRP